MFQPPRGRRAGLVALLVLACVLLATSSVLAPAPQTAAPAVAAAAPARPNVLVVMVDDMRWDELRYLPNVRRYLRDRGLTWNNSFATTPLCCPNRATFLTGRYAHNHQVWWHEAPWGYGSFDDRSTIAGAMQRAGYRTGYVGKYLNLYGEQPPYADPDHLPATYVPNGWHQWRGTPDSTGLPASDPREGSTYSYLDTTINANGTLVGHQGVYSSRLLVDTSLQVIDRWRSRTSDPWYLQLNSVAPHNGGPREPDDPGVAGDRSTGTPARPRWVRGRFDSVIPRAPGVPAVGDPEPDMSDKQSPVGDLPRLTAEWKRFTRTFARQRAEALFALDSHLGRLFRDLAAHGELRETILVFTSDNGYLLGEHRVTQGKNQPYEPSYRVPLLMAGPGIPRGVRHAPATTLDLSATVLDWTGATLRGTDGRSLAGDVASPRGWVRPVLFEAGASTTVSEEFGEGRKVMGVRTPEYAYFRWRGGGVELYDMRRDPNQLRSVAGDPDYATVQAELEAVLQRLKDCAGDACRISLPESLQVSASEAAALYALQMRQKNAYYGD